MPVVPLVVLFCILWREGQSQVQESFWDGANLFSASRFALSNQQFQPSPEVSRYVCDDPVKSSTFCEFSILTVLTWSWKVHKMLSRFTKLLT
jgi:hypothetical protein